MGCKITDRINEAIGIFSKRRWSDCEGTYTNYENLDDVLVSIHDYLKFVKFGFERANGHTCLDIRNGCLSKQEAIELVKKYDGKLYQYVVDNFINHFDITKEEFFHIVDSRINKALFLTDERGSIIRDKKGSLIKRYQDYEEGI